MALKNPTCRPESLTLYYYNAGTKSTCYHGQMSKSVTRLYQQFQPKQYDLELSFKRDTLSFEGTVTIQGKKVGRPSKRLTLHQQGLKITTATVQAHQKGATKEIPVARINTHDKLHEVRLHCNDMVYPGEYTIQLNFHGTITDAMHGIYPSRYTNGGKNELMITTQFESHHAREAFPCIDEPEAKAVFNVTITDSAEMTTLSNMPAIAEKTIKTKRQTTFATTPVMPPYLLAFVSSKLHCLEKKTKDGVIVRSWCTPNHPVVNLTHSVDEAVRILEFFSDYFQTPYPLPKYDQIAVPDFDAGAMENWGLATFREVLLLSDPDNPSVTSEQFISLVVSHEASHMWFGDLVTMRWWDDLWLNESFASLMEHLALDAIHPEWKQWEMYASDDIAITSSRDVYKDIQPVSVQVTDPDLIESLFDPGIVYAKGGRLLKMLREFIGDEAFRAGLKTYFTKHAYKNTERSDLWHSLTKSSGLPIDELMTPWLMQPGMPVVHVDQSGATVHISQERFTLDECNEDTIWPIPLLATEALPISLFDRQAMTFELDNKNPIVLNEYGSGHYIVDYVRPAHRQAIVKLFSDGKLQPEARMTILNDMYMLSRKGMRSLVDILEVNIANKHEVRDGVWSLMLRGLGAAQQLTEGDEDVLSDIKAFKYQLAHGQYRALGWDDAAGDDLNTKQLRHTMLSLMIGAEDRPTVEEALSRFEAAKQLTDLPAEIRSTIMVTAVRFGDKDVVDMLLKAYPTSNAELQSDITAALAGTRDAKVAEHILTTALGDDGFVRAQDLMRWYVHFFRNHYTRDVVWEYFTKNWKWFEKMLSQSKSYDYLPTYTASSISTDAWLQKYEKFFTELDDKQLAHNIELGLADARSRIAWRKREEKRLTAFFKAKAQE